MTTTLYLVRHAKSSWSDITIGDHDRPLRDRGRRRAANLAVWLEEHSAACDLVLCSTALRTRQTLEILLPVLGKAEVRHEEGLYQGDARRLVSLLRRTPVSMERVMVVGHDPVLQTTAQCLAATATGDAMDRLDCRFPTSALAMLTFGSAEWTGLRGHMGHLEFFFVPPD